jgi:hypothetical protein
MRMRCAAWGAGFVAVLALAGCGDAGSMAEVKGKVTFDNKPVESGAIAFYPVDGKAPTAGGAIKDGQYDVKVPVGLAKVTISAPKVVGKKKLYNTPNSPEGLITAEALPAKYNEQSELQFEVKPGRNEKDFELRSK